MSTLGEFWKQLTCLHTRVCALEARRLHVEDEGVELTDLAQKFNFVGAGVTVTEPDEDELLVTIPGGGGGGGNDIIVQDEGSQLTPGVTLFNFVGGGVTVTQPVANQVEVSVPGGGLSAAALQVTAVFDGGGFAITPNQPVYAVVPASGTLTQWTLIGSPAGGIKVDVWKVAGAVPTNANSITAGSEPELINPDDYEEGDPVADGWVAGGAVAAGDVIGFNVDTVTGVQWAALTLGIT